MKNKGIGYLKAKVLLLMALLVTMSIVVFDFIARFVYSLERNSTFTYVSLIVTISLLIVSFILDRKLKQFGDVSYKGKIFEIEYKDEHS